jgi:hypothetical protein
MSKHGKTSGGQHTEPYVGKHRGKEDVPGVMPHEVLRSLETFVCQTCNSPVCSCDFREEK